MGNRSFCFLNLPITDNCYVYKPNYGRIAVKHYTKLRASKQLKITEKAGLYTLAIVMACFFLINRI